jgi:hypothetical protein
VLVVLSGCGPSGVAPGSSSTSAGGSTSGVSRASTGASGASTSAVGGSTTSAGSSASGTSGTSGASTGRGTGSSSGGTTSKASTGGSSSGSSTGSSTSGGSLEITTASLPNATVGVAYSQALAAAGGSGTGYVFNQVSAAPNNGLWTYVTPAGTVSGTPEMAEVESVVYQVTDSAGNTAQKTLSLTAVATGALSIVSPATLPAAVNGGYFAYHLIAQGGVPPFIWSSTITPQPCYVDWDGWLLCAPTGATALSIPVTVTDSYGSTASQTEALSVGAVLTLAGIDSTDDVIHLPPAITGNAYVAHLNAYGGSGSGYVFTATAGLPSWATLSSSGELSGTPTESGAIAPALEVKDSSNNTATASALINISSAGQVSRPSYNSAAANGFFVLNGQLYDPNGFPFAIRGIDRCHYDSTTWAGGLSGALSGANAVRIFQYNIGDQTGYYAASQFFPIANAQSIANGILPIITATNVPNTATGTSGDQTLTDLGSVVAWWIDNVSVWQPIMNEIAINIANEWGPSASTAWQYSYQDVEAAISNISGTTITVSSNAATNPFANTTFAYIMGAGGITSQVVDLSAPGGAKGAWTVTSSVSLSGYTSGGTLYGGAVGALRAAGYTCPLVIDAGGYGQDLTDLVSYSADIQASDPLQNCIFSFHAYGGTLNYYAKISDIASSGSTTTVTLDSDLPYHPFSTTYPASGNTYTGQDAYVLAGVQGMTSINGLQTTNHNNVGGTKGAWTVTLDGTFSGTYVSGTGTIVTSGDYEYIISQLAALRSQNVAAAVLEFGPGNQTGDPTTGGLGPSPTNTSVQQIITAAEAYQVPWAYWAWDDNDDTGGATAFTGWFGATLNGPGDYARNAPSDLTATGMDIILNPRFGLGALASPAAVFQ